MEAFDIDVNKTDSNEKKSDWLKLLFSLSPYCMLKVKQDGTIIYADQMSFSLPRLYGLKTGEKLPSKFMHFAKKAISKEEVWNIRHEGQKKDYLLLVESPEREFIHIYAFEPASFEAGFFGVKDSRIEIIRNSQSENFSQDLYVSAAETYPELEFDKFILDIYEPINAAKEAEISKTSSEFMEVMQGLSRLNQFGLKDHTLREKEDTLKIALEVQKILWTIINNSPAVVFLWKNEENWPADFVSDNISQFGYTAEDFTSKKVLYGNIIHKDDLNKVRQGLDQLVRAGHNGFRLEYRIYTKDGTLRWVDERTFIQRDHEGKATYFQGLVIDITDRKLAEEVLEKAELQRKRDLNHRIKNNLQIVSSLLDLQAEKFEDK